MMRHEALTINTYSGVFPGFLGKCLFVQAFGRLTFCTFPLLGRRHDGFEGGGHWSRTKELQCVSVEDGWWIGSRRLDVEDTGMTRLQDTICKDETRNGKTRAK